MSILSYLFIMAIASPSASLLETKADKPTILVTGGAGYIGAHAVLALELAGYQTVILDNLEYGHQALVERHLKAKLIIGDTTDRPLLDELFSTYNIAAVMHFAAYIAVGESVSEPAKYYRNNVYGTLNLLEAMTAANVKRLVFSSTCAIYGPPKTVPIPEDHPQNPISPYATSKLMVEKMLLDFQAAYGLQSVCFRYFNAAGADPQGRLGEDHSPETHLIPLVLFAALGKRESISIFGTDYDTRDGTCIRDYIHVCDLAAAHVKGVEYLLAGGETSFFNLGNGSGFTVKEVIEVARRVTGEEIRVVECDRRPGDPPSLVGTSDRAQKILNWTPQYPDLENIITHAWQWHQKRHGE
ncbi:MAG: UDP-glucose 4-epimerase GalE [Phormidesmis sp.]